MINTDAASLKPELGATTPGALLSLHTQEVGLFTNAAQRLVMTYRSRGIHSEPIVASGFILLPKGEAPAGGWPVLAWAHGTSGVADNCAPSNDFVGGPTHAYQQLAAKPLNAWLACGYAVVAPDYQGLGTPGGHRYINTQSQLHTVVDAARAIQFVTPHRFSKQWYVMGHSQGGAATLAVAALGQQDAPELELRGALAIAPGGYQYQGIAEYVATHSEVDPHAAGFLPIVLLGAEAAEPGLDVMNLVSPEMGELVDRARTHCLSQMQADVKEVPKAVFKPGANLTPLIDYMKGQSIDELVPTVPVMLVQGDADKLVDYNGSYAYYQSVCKQQKPIAFYPMKGADHHAALTQTETLVRDFIETIEQGRFTGTCGRI